MTDSSEKKIFKGASVKIARARKHIQEIEKLAADYWSTDPVESSASPLTDGRFGMRFSLTILRMPPDEMSAALGDTIHNLRSALDLMASELARMNGKSDKKVYFPFAESESELERMIDDKNFRRAGESAVKLLKEFKPYKNGNIMLRAIHDLDIQDKHKLLIPHRVGAGMPILELYDDQGRQHSTPKVVGNPNQPSEKKLVFPEDCALKGRDLIKTLYDLVEVTMGVVEAFKILFTPSK